MPDLAHTAIAQLVEMVNGRTPAWRSVLPTSLVVRESSGPPRDAASHISSASVSANGSVAHTTEAYSADGGPRSGAASA
jgi:hypothetical protein